MFAFAQSRRAVPLLIVLVTMLFLFPVEVGSFQATHGPITTLNESLVGVFLQALIALAGCILLNAGALRCCFRFARVETALLLKLSDRSPFSLRC
jgi:hypothetical protein